MRPGSCALAVVASVALASGVLLGCRPAPSETTPSASDGGPKTPDGSAADDAGTDAGATATTPAAGQPDIDHLTEEALTELTSFLASDALEGRNEGTAGHDIARDELIERLAACGVAPASPALGYVQDIVGGTGQNVIGRIPGSDPRVADRYVLLGAHYDHLGFVEGAIHNGANDNAAGVAAMIGVACTLAQHPPARSVLIIGWDSEEPPTFLSDTMGSKYFVANPIVPLEQMDVAVTLDLLGSELWPGYSGHFVMGAELSPRIASLVNVAVASTHSSRLKVMRGGLHLVEQTPFGLQPWSDYDAFRQAGVPVLFLSDGQNKRYHTPEDDVSALSFPKLAAESAFLFDVVYALATSTQTPVFEPSGTDYAHDANTVVGLLEAATTPGGMVEKLALGATSTAALQADLANARAVQEKTTAATALTSSDIAALRRATQRIMCLAGSYYPEATCNQL